MSVPREAGRPEVASPPAAPVWGREDLTCPLTTRTVRAMLRHAHDHPWRGNEALTCPRHFADTTAITEPGRPVRLLLSLDFDYHGSGWFANSDYERCLHLSISYPRRDRPRIYLPGTANLTRPVAGHDVEAPPDTEVRAWGRVFFHAAINKTWLEPPVGPLDPHRAPGVAHLRLYLDPAGHIIQPRGEVYHLVPFADGTSPEKITEGRAGADVR